MFKSTKNLRAEQFDRLTEDVGGTNNAFTQRRRHGLPRGRAVEPPRDAALGRGRADGEPEGRRGELQVRARGGRGGVPPARPRLAVRPLLQRDRAGVVPRASVQAAGDRQHRGPRRGDARRRASPSTPRYYRPDNATLVVAGDFDPEQLDAWVDKLLRRRCRSPAAPLPRVDAQRAAVDRGPRVAGDRPAACRCPRSRSTWLAPPVTSADAPALQVAAALLAAGESSRLNQSLVYRQPDRDAGRLRAPTCASAPAC